MRVDTKMVSRRMIAYNCVMMKSILAGLKTQTRRPVVRQEFLHPAPTKSFDAYEVEKLDGTMTFGFSNEDYVWRSPFGKPGDIIGCRESAKVLHYNKRSMWMDIQYMADGATNTVAWPYRMKWTPIVGKCIPNGCHKEAVRIELSVKRVWVERVQDISETDAIAEGVMVAVTNSEMWPEYDKLCQLSKELGQKPPLGFTPRARFQYLWRSIYGTWRENPWVWCCEFDITEDKGE